MIWIPREFWSEQDLSRLPLGTAADAAFRIFCTPELSHYRSANHQELARRARFHLRNAEWRQVSTPVATLQTYTFEPNRNALGTVLVVHGWTGEASFMTAIAEPIRRMGFRVVLFDLPAHGLSRALSTNLIDCARATAYLAAELGRLEAIVAHSFGGMISLVAAEGRSPMPFKLDVPRFALIASPNRLAEVTADFGRHWRLSASARSAFERRLERVGERPLRSFVVAKLLNAIGSRALIVHDRSDSDVSFDCAEEIVRDVAGAELQEFSGFGHNNILFAPPVMRAVASFLSRERD